MVCAIATTTSRSCSYFDWLSISGTHIQRHLDNVLIVVMNVHWRHFLSLYIHLIRGIDLPSIAHIAILSIHQVRATMRG